MEYIILNTLARKYLHRAILKIAAKNFDKDTLHLLKRFLVACYKEPGV